MKITIDFPNSFFKIFNLPEDDLSSILKLYLALYLFEKRKLSFGKARELSGLNVWDFMEKLKENKIALNYDIEEFKEDIKTINDYEKSYLKFITFDFTIYY